MDNVLLKGEGLPDVADHDLVPCDKKQRHGQNQASIVPIP
jgi:hypothetical protein